MVFSCPVYSTAIDADAPHLSGPGRRLQLHDVINVGTPDEISDESHASLRLNLSPLAFGSQYGPRPELDRSPEAYGYPFHSACWHLLSARGSLTPSDIHLFFDLCRSCPIQQGLMNWGHDHGALLDIWAHDYGGMQDAEVPPTPEQEPQLVTFPLSIHRGPDPLSIPDLARVFASPNALPATLPASPSPTLPSVSDSSQQAVMPFTARMEGGDGSVFSQVPVEILSMIFDYLPSIDVARLRLASRTFANVALLESFWASRFLPGREFDYVIEARQPSLVRRGSWKQAFESVKALATTEATVERRRIWRLGLSLHGILQMLRDVECEGTPIPSFFEWRNGAPEASDAAWVTASRALRAPSELFAVGSRCLYEREIGLPPPGQVTAVFVSTIQLFNRRYISGIRIEDSRDRSFLLGYRHSRFEILIPQTNAQHHFTGFCLAQDQHGVRGLAVIFQTELMSPWIGDHDDIPKRRLLTDNTGLTPVKALRGGFDVCSNSITLLP